ncbi:hypothetical protein QLX08_002204 [Tetragonisca angustula]|uniref:Sperm mitochondrial-associated cysteine-rich protein-like n=1 Tax=Tetragonisca angustula TaxID=166442 RepID=A0AAW1AEN1_9HYME
MNCCSVTQGTWNDLEEMKYLLCAIECCKCPSVLPPPTCSVVLPPRIEELCPVIPPQRPCCPPPRCPPTPSCPQSRPCPPSPPCCAPSPPRCSPSPLCCKIPIVPGPVCFPPSICAPLPSRSCCPPSPLPCYPISYC